MPSYSERLGGGAVCPLCRETASNEAEMSHPLEGRSATLERGGKMSHPLEGRSATLERGGVCPAGPRGTLERGGDRFRGFEGDANGPHAGLL